MARKIRIPEAAFKPIKITPGEAILTTFGFYGRFDQLVADCMQLKKRSTRRTVPLYKKV